MNNGASPLILRKLAIRRMAGLASGFTLDDLSPGVNVIYGPNGVGKSRTALALNLALWPRDMKEAGRDAVSAWFDLGPETWAVDIDAGEVRHQRNGVDTDPPNLPGIETRDRYNLPLQDLLFDRGENFARAIGRESAGGYDLSTAAVALGFDRKPSVRTTKETDALLQTGRAVKERRDKLASLRQREQELNDLIRSLDEAQRAAARVPQLKAALALLDARRELSLAEERLHSLPPDLAKLTGRELDQLEQLRADIAAKEQAIGRAAQDLERARAALAAARFTDAPADETVISTLTGFSRSLVGLQNQRVAQEQEVQAAVARRQLAARAIGPAVSEEKLQRLDLKGIDELAAFAREAEKSRGDLIAIESVRRWLTAALPQSTESASPDDGADADRLADGLRILSQWLRQPGAAAPANDHAKSLVLAAAGLVVVLSLLLAWQWRWSAAILALAGPLLYYLWQKRSATPGAVADARPIFKQQYAGLRLEQPAGWSVDAVEETSRLLFERLAAARLRRERADRLADQQPQLQAASQRAGVLATRREQLAARLGLAPSVDESTLYALVEAALRWQQAAGDVAGATARLEALHEQNHKTFAAAANLLRQFDYEVSDPAEIDATCENLRVRCEKHRSASTNIAHFEAQIVDLKREIAAISTRADAVFTAIGLTPGDDATLQQWLDLRPEFIRAKSSLDIATARAKELASNLRETPDLMERPRTELELDLAEATRQSESLQSLAGKISAIQTEIDLAQHASDLEEAQAQQREAAAALAASRAEDCDLTAGWVLLEHLRTVSRERHQSAVFRRAREIFARITRGRYRLEFDDRNGTPVFHCIDTLRGFGQSLDELSSGTRVQLLLAVRVAFVEQQEQGPRLPLILDETLANSDETRARQILDAILEISRGGRQVFYFTAQPDEVGKWQEVLAAQQSQPGVDAIPYRLIDLAAVRGLAESERTPPRQIVTAPAALVPPPDGRGPDEYARLLQVPGIDPWQPTAGGVHLWHLIDDLSALHNLLALGIRSWGQWKTMAEVGGLGIADAADLFTRAESRARLLESLAKLWRIGRGNPVDRQAILNADVISDKFLDPVAALAAAESGDARRLIAKLEEGAIRGFRSNIAERLKNWLQDNGYLDTREVLTPEEMRLRAVAMSGPDLQAGRITTQLIDEYIATWFTERTPLPADLASANGNDESKSL